ncbi:MAG: D-ribose pyranase [Solirubrobacteraceae bacterium]|jgi:D-ribose pyranose/furanose isomerase RbsD
MRTQRILHPQLARAVAELGHTDVAMVVDAGFPIPRTVERIDLGLWPGIPTVVAVLEVLRRELHVEQVRFAPEVATHNPRFYDELQRIYTGSGALFATVTHERLIAEVAPQARFIVRSGDLQPWGNVALTASTDPFAWFTDDAVARGMTILPDYVERRRRISDGEVPRLP